MARLAKLVLPTAAPDESPLVSICLNKEWAYILFNISTRLEWQASWKPDTDFDLAEQRVFALYTVLQQFGDCDAMDCCEEIEKLVSLQKYPTPFELLDKLPIAQSELALIQTEYGTNGSGIVSGATDDDLCAGITAFVRAACEYAASKQELLTYGYSGLALALAAGSALVLFGVLTGGLGLAAGLAVAGLGGTFGALTGADLVLALRNRDNQDLIICQLLEFIVSSTVPRSEYDSALSLLNSANNDEGAVVWALQNYFANDEGHYMLLSFVNQAKDGYVTECADCPEGDQTVTFDAGSWDYELLVGTIVNGVGNPNNAIAINGFAEAKIRVSGWSTNSVDVDIKSTHNNVQVFVLSADLGTVYGNQGFAGFGSYQTITIPLNGTYSSMAISVQDGGFDQNLLADNFRPTP